MVRVIRWQNKAATQCYLSTHEESTAMNHLQSEFNMKIHGSTMMSYPTKAVILGIEICR